MFLLKKSTGILLTYKKHPLSIKTKKALKTQSFQGFLITTNSEIFLLGINQ
jgi:hypothetical protein